MRRLVKLAIIMAVGAWIWSRLSKLGKDNAYRDRLPWWDEETQLPPKPLEDYRDAAAAVSMADEPDQSEGADVTSSDAPQSGEQDASIEPRATGEIKNEAPPTSLDMEPAPAGDLLAENPAPFDDGPAAEAKEGAPAEDVPWSFDEDDEGQKPKSDWSLSAGPDGEEKLRRTREEVDERLRNLSSQKMDEGNAA